MTCHHSTSDTQYSSHRNEDLSPSHLIGTHPVPLMLATTWMCPAMLCFYCSKLLSHCTSHLRQGGVSTCSGHDHLRELLSSSSLEGFHQGKLLPTSIIKKLLVGRIKLFFLLTSATASGSVVSVAFFTLAELHAPKTRESSTTVAKLFIFLDLG